MVLREPEEKRNESPPRKPPAVEPARATVSKIRPDLPDLETAGDQSEAQETLLAARVAARSSDRESASPESDASEDQALRIRKILEDYGKQAGRNRAERRDQIRDIERRLEKISIAAAGYDDFPDYKGARVGAVRTFSDSGADPAIAEKVKSRYDIRISVRYLHKPGGLSYLNSAASGGSVYHPADKAGYYEVFEISEKAYRQMVILENEWLVSHGYDPARTRIDTVEFGIVERSPGFWDLGIVRARVQELASPGAPTTTAPMAN